MAEYLIQDTTLDAIADAINAKTGGSSAMTPAQMVTAIAAIPSGGGTDTLGASLAGTLENYENDSLTSLEQYSFYYGHTAPKNLRIPNVTAIGKYAFGYQSHLESIFAPKAFMLGMSIFNAAAQLVTAVLGAPNGQQEIFRAYTTMALVVAEFAISSATENQAKFSSRTFYGCKNLKTIILRSPVIYASTASDMFSGSTVDSGGSGCTIYIPKVLYDHLGDGTSLDYKAATNWSTVDAYGTITWAQIEGSIYETKYADGTPIPSE